MSMRVTGGMLRWLFGGLGQGMPSTRVQPPEEGRRGAWSNVQSTEVGGATCSQTLDQRRVRSAVRCLLRSTAEGHGEGTRESSASCTFVSGDIGSLPGSGVHQTI